MIRSIAYISLFISLSFAIWPLPTQLDIGNDLIVVHKDSFSFLRTENSSKNKEVISLLDSAFDRYLGFIFPKILPIHPPFQVTIGEAPKRDEVGSLSKVFVQVRSDESSLVYGVDESYRLNITSNSGEITCLIDSETVWGALHAVETLSQLITWNGSNYISSYPVSIYDTPRFNWRGLLVDTARHYLTIDTIKKIIDTLEWNKMNVFHWHVIDAESFPIETKSHPDLYKKGSWVYPYTIYTQDDVKSIISYAYERGVRVVPEFDGPGHCYSWSKAYPWITINCPNTVASKRDYPWINVVPLDMRNDSMYDVLFDFLNEMINLFTDDYIHLGGDEVSSKCLNEDPSVKKWMTDHGMDNSSYDPLVNYYERKVINFINNKKIPIFWEEVFIATESDKDMKLPNGTIVSVWISENSSRIIRDIILSGSRAILSSGWYLDQQVPKTPYHFLFEDTWKDFYLNDPLNGLDDVTDDIKKLVIGGEACLWGEENDDLNIFSRIWPRASATAERLWSSSKLNNTDQAFHRLVPFRCNMQMRGQGSISVSPIRPDYCPLILSSNNNNIIYQNVTQIVKEKEHFPGWIIGLEVSIFVAIVVIMITIYVIKLRSMNNYTRVSNN